MIIYYEYHWSEDTRKSELENTWDIEKENDYLIVRKNGVPKKMKVKYTLDDIWDIRPKKHIKAIDGINGLCKYIEKCINDNFCTVFVNKILHHAWNNGKEI